MRELRLLGKRACVEQLRMPEATFPLLFIPLFFLIINVGTFADAFQGAPFLAGQSYASFQLPSSLMFAVVAISSGLSIVTEIENGYFDKLLVSPVRRTSLLVGRLFADFVRNVIMASIVLLGGLFAGLFVDDGVHVESGFLGAVVLIVIAALFGVAYGASAIWIAIASGKSQTVNLTSFLFFPLLFIAPQALPREEMEPWLSKAAAFNPVTYVIEGLRSLILDGWELDKIVYALLVIVGSAVLLVGGSVRSLNRYGK